MRFILSCLAAGLVHAESQTLESQLTELLTLKTGSPAFDVWDQTNRQLLGVLKDMETQHNLYKNDKSA